MQSALYVTLSAQVALERRMNTVANNVANMNTAGFRADEVTFESLISTAGRAPVSFVSQGEDFISRQAGPVTETGNSLDVAVRGESWFSIQMPEGVRYTRDGRMTITEAGDIMTVTGYPVLDAGGGPLVVDPLGGDIVVASDGTVSQGGNMIGAIGLFMIAPGAQILRAGDSAIEAPAQSVQPVQDFVNNGVLQGYVEGANVNPVVEMTRLIMAQRQFEQAASATSEMEGALGEAIRTLGPSS